MSKRSFARFSLWMVKPFSVTKDDALRDHIIAIVKRAALYFGMKDHEHFVLTETVSFAYALKICGAQTGIKTTAFLRSESMLPLVARDKRRDVAVLLLPQIRNYLVYEDGERTVAPEDLATYFDEIVMLRPINKPLTSIENFLRKLVTKIPWSYSIFVSLCIALLFIAFIFLCFFLQTDVGDKNRSVLIVGAITLAIAVVVLLKSIDAIVTKNYGLIAAWLFDNVFRRFLKLPAEKIAKTSAHDLEFLINDVQTGLHHLFVTLPHLIAMIIFASVVVACVFLKSIVLATCLIVGGLGIIALLWQAKKQSQSDRKNYRHARYDVFLLLGFYERSRISIRGLDLSGSLAVRLDRVYEHARSAHERMHLKTIIDGAYVMAPCVFFVVSVYVMNEPSVVTLAIFGALAFVFVGETCHKISHFGFDEATTAVINSWPHEAQRAHVEPVHLEGGIELAAISFAHAKSSHPLFRDLSIKIDAKDYVLITGPSGSGKTSLLKIFAGAYSPYKGEILFDGQDARALNQTSLRMTFGVIFDNADIFVGSIYQNIMCQRPLAPKALERLLMSHEVFDVLLDLPMALQTYIIDRGKNISRLQRMAILLARALVHQPKFLFVDDIYGGLSLKDQHIVENFIASLSITRIITLPQAAPWMKPDKSIALPLDVRTAENS